MNESRRRSARSVLAEHRKWWHAFYPKSFLTIPDARMEAFYWIQMYKFAAASREGGPAVDLFGPWFRVSQWPGIWWNLNIQLTYWPVYAGNHLELGDNYIDTVDGHFDGLLAGFINATTLGDFAWAMHNYWWQFRFAGDWKSIHEKWTPKAKAVLAGYLPRLKKNADGRLELTEMGSPGIQRLQTLSEHELQPRHPPLAAQLPAGGRRPLRQARRSRRRRMEAHPRRAHPLPGR